MATETDLKNKARAALVPLSPYLVFKKQYLDTQGRPVKVLKGAASVVITTPKECLQEVLRTHETKYFLKDNGLVRKEIKEEGEPPFITCQVIYVSERMAKQEQARQTARKAARDAKK